MNKVVLMIVVFAFTGAVGVRALDEPALGGGSGVYQAPASVTVCTLEEAC